MKNRPLKPGEMQGRLALLKMEKVSEETAKNFLKSPKTPKTDKLTKGDARGPGKHYKGIYN